MRAFIASALYVLTTISLWAQSTFPELGISTKDNLHYLIKGAKIHSEPGLISEGALLIHRGKIKAIGNVGEELYPKNTIVLDYTGLHIYPSFIETNSSYGLPSEDKKPRGRGPKTSRSKNVSSYWNEAFHPEYNASADFSPDFTSPEQLLRMGFGIALTHKQDGIGRGTSSLVLIGGENANEMLIKEKAAQHFSFNKGSSSQDYPSSLMGSISLLRQALYDAKWYESEQSKETNSSLQAFIENKELPLIFEAEEANDILRIQKICEEFDLKAFIVGESDSYQVTNLLRENIVGLTAPLDFPKPFDMRDPELSRLVSQEDLLNWERSPFNPRIIVESSTPLVLSGNGLKKSTDFFKNLRSAIKHGLNADDAFASLTTVPADILQASNIGRIAKGKLANFFVADKDVFHEDSPEILEHWIKGEKISLEQKDKIDFAGKYDLNLNDKYYKLSLKGTDEIKGEVSLFTQTDTLTSKVKFSAQGNEIVLSFVDPKTKGNYRLSGTSISDNRIWDGRGVDPQEEQILWSAIRVKEVVVEKTQPDSAQTESIVPIPQMTFPLTAYGHDSLPEYANIHIKNATVWTLEGEGKLENASVLISNGKVKAVGQKIEPSLLEGLQNLEEIDAAGMHVTPGIIDEHSHIAITRGVNEGTQSSSAEVRIADALSPGDINIYRQLAGGVTTAQLLHGSANPIGGQSAIIKMRWGEDMNGMIFEEAAGFIKFALGENVKQSNWGDNYNTRYPQTRMGVEQYFYDSFYRAKEYGQLKKLYEAGKNSGKKKKGRRKKDEPSKKSFRTDLELEALLEILESERFITCHSYVQSEINMLMHVADSMGFTLNTFTHILEGYKLANKMKTHGAAASTFSDWWAYKYEVKDAIPHNASILNRMGVLTAINSDDAEMGRRLNQEAAKGIRYGGMTEVEALKMVTLNPAIMLHVEDRVGSLKVGKDADIVIWDDNPLSVYAKAQKTFVDGKLYFDREEMEKRKKRDDLERNRIASKMIEAAENGSATQLPKRKMERYYHCDSKD
ncbi:MAG: amidohydrolase family protein [Flavobacteriales bacterium]|nr:amidohydrolase family protein [Flavobacteriales bacterium]